MIFHGLKQKSTSIYFCCTQIYMKIADNNVKLNKLTFQSRFFFVQEAIPMNMLFDELETFFAIICRVIPGKQNQE